MKKCYSYIVISLMVSIFLLTTLACNEGGTMADASPLAEKSIYDFVMKDIDGNDVKMEQYRGKALLLVNVASECGYTPQYKGLQSVYAKYKDRGFFVLGFPANNFGAQEPGSNQEIKTFCSAKFSVTFPMFAKISVKGGDKHPFYRFLTEKTTNPGFDGDIKWNFNKFLVDKTGKVIARFDSDAEPEGTEVISAIEKAL